MENSFESHLNIILNMKKPDYKLKKAKKIINTLDDNEENRLIKYYIQKKEEYIEYQNNKLKEYRDFFNKFNEFLPNRKNLFNHDMES